QWYKERIQPAHFFQQFHHCRALPGNDIGMIERWYECQPLLLDELTRNQFTILVLTVVGDDACAIAGSGVTLSLRGVQRHDDGGSDVQCLGCPRDCLPVIARREGHHPRCTLSLTQLGNSVISTSELKRTDLLQVFTFEEDLCVQASVKCL